MGDSQEGKTEIIDKIHKQEIEPKASSGEPEKKSTDKIMSEEKLERLHEAAFSKSSVEPVKIQKSKENIPAIETAISREERPVPKEEIKDGKPAESVRKEENELEERNKTEAALEKQRVVNSMASCGKHNREKIVRNQSDIFSLKEVPTTLQTSIFSVNGCPSRKLFRKQEPVGHLFQRTDNPPADKVTTSKGIRITKENYNDEKRPSSSYRNPLTGSGLSSNDEYKTTNKGAKRKDGNPLLGLGYDTEVVSSVASQHRIPPGGFSHKLW